MKIYLVRHGETEWNRKEKIQGQADIPLNGAGEALARLTGKAMAGIPFDRAYTSPLVRARRTAELILENRPIPVLEDRRLAEISYGSREGQSLGLIHKCPFLRLHRFFAEPAAYIPPRGGESLDALRARGLRFFHEVIFPLEGAAGHILITAHGAWIREMVCAVEGIPRTDFWKGPPQKNCAVTTLSCENGNLRLLEEGVVYACDNE